VGKCECLLQYSFVVIVVVPGALAQASYVAGSPVPLPLPPGPPVRLD